MRNTLGIMTLAAALLACDHLVDGDDPRSAPVATATANRVPSAAVDTASTGIAGAVDIRVLANDSDPDGDALVVTAVGAAAHGSVALNPNGVIRYTMSSSVGWQGTDHFVYTIGDGQGGSSTGDVIVSVGPDRDGDGLTDLDEAARGTDPGDDDSDDDGITDGLEAALTGTSPRDDDSDDDGITDGREDLDRDGVVDADETGALLADSDGDGLGDGIERGLTVAQGKDTGPGFVPDADPTTTTDPRLADSDGGGIKDGVEDASHDGRVDPGERDPNLASDDRTGAMTPPPVAPAPGQIDRDGDGFHDDVAASGGGCSAAGPEAPAHRSERGGSGWPIALLMVLAAVIRGRRRASAGTRARVAPALIASVLLTTAARPVRAEETNFAIERLRLTASRDGLIDVAAASTLGHLRSDLGLWMGFERDPLVLRDISSGARIGSLIERRWGGSLVGALGVGSFVEIGLELPLVMRQKRPEGQPAVSSAPLGSLSSFGVGDLVVAPKVHLIDGLALQVAVSLPTGRSNYRGGTRVLVQPEVLAATSFGALRVGFNAGYRMRPHVPAGVRGETLTDELTSRLGLGYRLGAGDHPAWEIAASLAGATSAPHPFGGTAQNALEANVQIAYDVTPRISAFVGGGPGLRRGVGTPQWRLFAGTRLGPGVPTVVAPGSGPRAAVPPAPPCAETPAGCPARDSDDDGLPDSADRCPLQKEDPDGHEDGDGCPDPDNDGDGVLDPQDACPMDNGPAGNRGCPERDRDNDGVADVLDNCPDERGLRDLAGCRHKLMVTLTRHEIALGEPLAFSAGSARLAPRFLPLLDDVANVIMAHSEISQIRIDVRCDDAGSDRHNLALAQRRADAVAKYLVKRGVFSDRLLARGLGNQRDRTAATRAAPPDAGAPAGAAGGDGVAFVIDAAETR
jgi:outer membrane protein OmpA-like peptidoglycan-associated protein